MAFSVTIKSLTVVLALASARPAISQTPQTRLWDGAISGDTALLAAALKDGAQIEALDQRKTPNGRRALSWAAINNHPDAIRWLLAHGANIEATNLTGYTALHHAAEYGSVDATRVLLLAGADPKHTNLEGVTPLARARLEGHLDVAELLEAAERGVRPKN